MQRKSYFENIQDRTFIADFFKISTMHCKQLALQMGCVYFVKALNEMNVFVFSTTQKCHLLVAKTRKCNLKISSMNASVIIIKYSTNQIQICLIVVELPVRLISILNANSPRDDKCLQQKKFIWIREHKCSQTPRQVVSTHHKESPSK